MTLYYLRKLINRKKAYLKWSNSDCQGNIDAESLFKNLHVKTEKASISLEALEQIVSLHQSLIQFHDSNSTQVADVEASIYEILGLEWVMPSTTEIQEMHKTTTITSHTWGELQESIQSIISQYQCKIQSNQIVHILKTNRPRNYLFTLFSVQDSGQILFRGPQNKVVSCNDFRCYERWIDVFVSECETLMKKTAKNEKCTPHEQKQQTLATNTVLPSEVCNFLVESKSLSLSNSFLEVEKDWAMLQALTQAIVTLNIQDLAMSHRTLVKKTNHMLRQARDLFTSQLIVEKLTETCPKNTWCQSFKISRDGSLRYLNNSLELVTASRFDQFRQWILCFNKECYRTHLGSLKKAILFVKCLTPVV